MEIKEIEKISLKPNDVILIRFSIEDYDLADMQSFYDHLSQNVFLSNDIVCLPSNMDLSIISQSKFPDIAKYFENS